MKRLLCIFIILVLVLSLLALPISADEVTTEASNEESTDSSNEESTDSSNEESTDSSNEESTDSSNEESTDSSNEESTDSSDEENRSKKEESFWDKSVNFFENTGKLIENTGKLITGFFNLFSFFEGVGDAKTTLESGGFNFIEPNSRLNLTISGVYKVLYPIGFIIMLLCWAFGMAKSTISASLDIKDKSSIIHSVIGLIMGVAAMSLAPQILTLLTGASQWICTKLTAESFIRWEEWETVTDIDILEIVLNTATNLEAALLVLIIIEYVFMINILWIALLQCLSPIFIGLMANQNTRKISFNFVREYFKAILLPIVTLIYYKLASALLWDFDSHKANHTASFTVGLIGAIVLGIATVSIAGKKLDKLIN